MMLVYFPLSYESDLTEISEISYSPENNPCNQGLLYQCFSEATAAQCGQVWNLLKNCKFILIYVIEFFFHRTAYHIPMKVGELGYTNWI